MRVVRVRVVCVVRSGFGPMFCSETYAAKLVERGVPVEKFAVPSDHWSVLNSQDFARVLQTAFVERRWPQTVRTKTITGAAAGTSTAPAADEGRCQVS